MPTVDRLPTCPRTPASRSFFYTGGSWAGLIGTSIGARDTAIWATAPRSAARARPGTPPRRYTRSVTGGYSGALNDITTGSNDLTGTHGGSFTASAGYDLASARLHQRRGGRLHAGGVGDPVQRAGGYGGDRRRLRPAERHDLLVGCRRRWFRRMVRAPRWSCRLAPAPSRWWPPVRWPPPQARPPSPTARRPGCSPASTARPPSGPPSRPRRPTSRRRDPPLRWAGPGRLLLGRPRWRAAGGRAGRPGPHHREPGGVPDLDPTVQAKIVWC